MTPQKIPVGVLGATGTVGQRFVERLSDHPWFELAAVAASDRSAGKSYADAARWRLPTPLPDRVASMSLRSVAEDLPCRIVFSALDAAVAREVEPACARQGKFVFSNASAFRMEPDVPLLIPEINSDSLSLIPRQQRLQGWKGAIVTNANCSVTVLARAVAPLHRAFSVRRAFVTTMQAVSGAGYPGVPSLDILGNVIPDIPDEAPKIERELLKILGSAGEDSIVPAPIVVAAATFRWPFADGHTPRCHGRARRARKDTARAWGVSAVPRTLQRPPPVPQRRSSTPAPHAASPTWTPAAAWSRSGGLKPRALTSEVHRLGTTGRRGRRIDPERGVRRRQGTPRLIIQKFGGTSVEDGPAMERVAAIVSRATSERPAVVVSAMGKTTNRLVEALDFDVAGDERSAVERVSRVRRDTLATVQEFFGRDAERVARRLAGSFEELDRMTRAVAALRLVPPASRDQFLAHGELVASAVTVEALALHGLPSVWVDAREVLITDGRFGRARPDLAEIARRAEQRIVSQAAQGKIPVLGGFIGATRSGQMTTLRRGVSDYSAAMLGATVGASAVEI